MTDINAWRDTGAWLKDLRLKAQITELELAEHLGAPTSVWIKEIEAGHRAVPVSFYVGYARTFDMPVAAFATRCAAVYGSEDQFVGAAA